MKREKNCTIEVLKKKKFLLRTRREEKEEYSLWVFGACG